MNINSLVIIMLRPDFRHWCPKADGSDSDQGNTVCFSSLLQRFTTNQWRSASAATFLSLCHSILRLNRLLPAASGQEHPMSARFDINPAVCTGVHPSSYICGTTMQPYKVIELPNLCSRKTSSRVKPRHFQLILLSSLSVPSLQDK